MKGLVLVGGKSSRMGEEKRLIRYHAEAQEAYLYELLNQFCEAVYISCNASQAVAITLPKIIDTSSEGPLSGISSAFALDSKSAWLVVACDLPLLNHVAIETLISQRNKSKIATAGFNKSENRPEPLFCIYEPSFKNLLDEAQKKGVRSPMNILLNNDYQKANVDAILLQNINTLAEKNEFLHVRSETLSLTNLI
jgi:molybdenum cofactor guanylyltransferase